MRNLLLSIPLLMLFACQEDLIDTVNDPSPSIERIWHDVDPLLVSHFINFENAAHVRGFDIDLSISGISAQIVELDDVNIAGQCTYGVHRLSPKEIIIDRTFWNSASQLYREYIVFHELGHCHLLRDHNDQCTDIGIWASIMRSGTIQGCRDFYNNRTREEYLDELFTHNNL